MTYLTNARIWIYFVMILMMLPFCKAAEALSVFPGAKGFGTDTRAAYGAANDPAICVVTDLTDDDNGVVKSTRNGVPVKTGSFLECINYAPPANTGKIIIFEVSGTIWAKSKPYTYEVKHRYTTIAGQTAPNPGITLRNINFQITNSDILVQHIRSRVGDAAAGALPTNRRSITIKSKSSRAVRNVVVDHLTATWGVDTCFTVWEDPNNDISDVTVSNCLIAEGLHKSLHPDTLAEGKGHSKGLALQIGAENISAIGNLIMSNSDRNPYVRWGSKVVVNNLIYNPLITNVSVTAIKGTIDLAVVGNVIKAGPATSGWGNKGFVLLYNDPKHSNNWDNSNIYLLDNNYQGTNQINSSDWSTVFNQHRDNVTPYKLTGKNPATSSTLWPVGLSAMPSSAVEDYVIANAGARPADRDSVDIRLINDVRNGTGSIIDSQDDVGGWPVLGRNTRVLSLLPGKPHSDNDGDGYTNLEEWLHAFAAEVEGSSAGHPISPPSALTITK